jgi:hypothetical protein
LKFADWSSSWTLGSLNLVPMKRLMDVIVLAMLVRSCGAEGRERVSAEARRRRTPRGSALARTWLDAASPRKRSSPEKETRPLRGLGGGARRGRT